MILTATYILYGSAVSCSRCLALLTKGLSSMEGVTDIKADKDSDTLTVEYDTDKIGESGIRSGARGAGFYKEQLYCIC
jgi:copper chaperone CopZ